MKFKCLKLTLGIISSTAATALIAASSTSQTLSVSVPEINSIRVGAGPVQLTITDYVAGTNTPIGNWASVSFTLTSNATTPRVVQVSADTGINALPAGAAIEVKANLGSGVEQGAGTASVTTVSKLSTTPSVIISGIQQMVIPSGTFTYVLTAPASAGLIPSTNISVTYAITSS